MKTLPIIVTHQLERRRLRRYRDRFSSDDRVCALVLGQGFVPRLFDWCMRDLPTDQTPEQFSASPLLQRLRWDIGCLLDEIGDWRDFHSFAQRHHR